MWGWIVALLGALVPILSSTVGRVMVALGLSVATFSGVDVALNTLKANIFSGFSGLPAIIIDVIWACRVDQGINIIFSAYAAVLVIKGTSGAITKFVHKGPA